MKALKVLTPYKGSLDSDHDREGLESMWLFFRAFRNIIGLGSGDGMKEPHRVHSNKEKAVIWRTLNGWKWTFTIEREKVK